MGNHLAKSLFHNHQRYMLSSQIHRIKFSCWLLAMSIFIRRTCWLVIIKCNSNLLTNQFLSQKLPSFESTRLVLFWVLWVQLWSNHRGEKNVKTCHIFIFNSQPGSRSHIRNDSKEILCALGRS